MIGRLRTKAGEPAIPVVVGDMAGARMPGDFRFDEGKPARLTRTPHRYIWPAELDLMAQMAGFEPESRHADWGGAEFTAESRSHVPAYRISAYRISAYRIPGGR